jgi:PAS domain S-box-containing protein
MQHLDLPPFPGGVHMPETDQGDAAERLRIATRAAHIGIWEWNLTTGAMLYSPIAREICGFSADEPIDIGKVRAATHPQDLPRTSGMAERALNPAFRENEVYRYRLIRADTGAVRWVEAYGEAEFGEIGGKPAAIRYVGTIQDITDHKLAEDALAASEARLRLAIEAAEMAVWELDTVAGTITSSAELNGLFGLPPDFRMTVADWRARYAPGEAERVQREWQELQAGGESRIQTEFRVVWPDGTEKWLLVRAQLLPDASHRAIGVMLDITERKRAEERMRTVAAELRHRVKNSLAVIGSIAARTLRNPDDPVRAFDDFQARLQAIGAATDLTLSTANEAARTTRLVEAVIAPYRTAHQDQFRITGTDATLDGKVATSLAMGIHELCTNAIKYGALSVAGGEVIITIANGEDGLIRLEWTERGGPTVTPPQKPGFGTRLLTQGLFSPPSGVTIDYHPSGVRCVFVLKTI